MRGGLLLWLILFTFLLTIQWYGERDLRKLQTDSIMTTGIVTAVTPDNHRTISYEFEVNGKKHNGLSGIASVETLKIGDAVQVYFLSNDPNTSRIGNPKNVAVDWESKLLSSIWFASAALAVSFMASSLKNETARKTSTSHP